MFFEIGLNLVLKVYLFNIFLDFVEDVLFLMKRNFEIEMFWKIFIDIFGKGIFVLWENVCFIIENIF